MELVGAPELYHWVQSIGEKWHVLLTKGMEGNFLRLVGVLGPHPHWG